jgi:xanthine/uracil permease
MKTFIYILIALALVLGIYNITLIDFSNLSEKQSTVALIGIVASISAVLLLTILLQSKKVEQKLKEKRKESRED